MDLDHLTLDIQYNIKNDKFEVKSDINKEGRKELIETFLRGQIGAGKDYSKPNKEDVYRIQLKWYPENDKIEVSTNTGNKGLRDGILMHFLKEIDKV